MLGGSEDGAGLELQPAQVVRSEAPPGQVASEVRQLGVEDHQHHRQEEDEDRDQALALVATAEER